MIEMQPAEPLTHDVRLRAQTLADGSVRSSGRVEDYFHGFTVEMVIRDGVIEAAEAEAFKHPWTTCPGALAAVPGLIGRRADDIRLALSELGRVNTCVHVNDLCLLVAGAHESRDYRVVCADEHISVERDGETLLDRDMEEWRIVGGPYDDYWMNDPRWKDHLGAAPGDLDLEELVLMVRRGMLVAMGLWMMDWTEVSSGHHIEYTAMPDSCWTFTQPRLSDAVSLVDPPRMKGD